MNLHPVELVLQAPVAAAGGDDTGILRRRCRDHTRAQATIAGGRILGLVLALHVPDTGGYFHLPKDFGSCGRIWPTQSHFAKVRIFDDGEVTLPYVQID